MPSKAAETAEPGHVRYVASDELPYEPSVPCARCARGVDPLRAACVSATERSVLYFCSRRCSAEYRAAESEHAERLESAARTVQVAPTSTRSLPVEAIARRVEPDKPTTPRWPLAASALALLVSALPFAGAERAAALGIVGTAAAFASRTALTRRECGVVGWLAAPVGVALLGLAALLDGRLSWLVAGALGVALMWSRERLIERAQGKLAALREELSSRFSPRVYLAHAERERSERPLAKVRVGDELSVEEGEVVPVDGVVTSGHADVLPHPHAREPLARGPGAALLAGARVVRGALQVRATRVGRDRALFAALEPTRAVAPFRWLRYLAELRRAQVALLALLPALALAPLATRDTAHALASFAAALFALPVLIGARGAGLPWRLARLRASAQGLCFRDGGALERTAHVDTAVVRVEGVLVERDYTLVEVCSTSPGHDTRALLTLALSAELAAEQHGIARALRAHAAPLGIEPIALRRPARTAGGVTALTDGEGTLVVGNRAALLAEGVSVAIADRDAQRAEAAGRRVVFLALGGRVRGLLVFEQTVRPEARVAAQTWFDLGAEVVLLSSDHRATLDAIARPLDVTQSKAELTASERAAEVHRLRDSEARVLAVGRLPSDEALLGAADVGLCLDAAELAGERDIVSASRDLREAAAALQIARAARRKSRAVLAACGAGFVLMTLGALALLPPWLAAGLALSLELTTLAREARPPDAAARPKAK